MAAGGRTLPEKKTERANLFRRLRQLRLIQFPQDTEVESDDAWLRIRPTITSFVNEAVLNQINEPYEQPETEDAQTATIADESSIFTSSDLVEE